MLSRVGAEWSVESRMIGRILSVECWAGLSEYRVVNHTKPWVSLGWFNHTEPPRTTAWQRGKQAHREGSSEFGAVRDWPHRTSSNHCDEWGYRHTGKVRVSLGRFDPTEPSRTTVTNGEAGLQGRLEWVWGGSTTSNFLELLWWRGKLAWRAVWSEFGEVRLHQTSSNHCHEGGIRPAGQVWVSTGRFNHTKPPRVSLGWFDHTEPPQTTVTKGEAGLQGRFTEPSRTTVTNGEAGLQGSFEWVWGGSTTSNLLEPLWWRGKLVGRAVWSEFGEVQLHQTFSNHCDVGGSRPIRIGVQSVERE